MLISHWNEGPKLLVIAFNLVHFLEQLEIERVRGMAHLFSDVGPVLPFPM
jgi:hypothetical protein